MKLDGEFDGKELWQRCPLCGDSKIHVDKAHYSVNVFTGEFFCFRCSAGGLVEGDELADYMRISLDRPPRSITSDSEVLAEISDRLVSRPGVDRYSTLSRFHFGMPGDKRVDVFETSDQHGDCIGYHLRPEWQKMARTYGQRGLGFSKASLYSPEIRLVEGPYDAIDPSTDVVTFGFPTPTQLRMLRGRLITLCPDGDVWQDQEKFLSYFRPFIHKSYLIKSVEVIGSGLDPDEVLPGDRYVQDFFEVRKLYSEMRPRKRQIAQQPPEAFLSLI